MDILHSPIAPEYESKTKLIPNDQGNISGEKITEPLSAEDFSGLIYLDRWIQQEVRSNQHFIIGPRLDMIN